MRAAARARCTGKARCVRSTSTATSSDAVISSSPAMARACRYRKEKGDELPLIALLISGRSRRLFRLRDPHLAPAVRVDELARENIARTPLIAVLALQLQ